MPSPAFVLGVPRSGTTLLRVMLAGHPRLFSPPEMIIAPFETMAQRRERLEQRFWEKGGLRRALMELEGIDVDAAKKIETALERETIPTVYAYLQERLGDRILVDKCPHLCATPGALERLDEWFADARYIWIVRHPGSVIRSVENMPYAELMLQGYAEDARDIWHGGNSVVESFLETIPSERWTRVRYEDLVKTPKPVMEKICATLGVPFHPDVLDPYEGDRMREGPKGARAVGDPNMASRGRIQPELATAWLEGFDPKWVSADTHAMAKRFGYDLDALPPPPLAKVTEGIAALFETAKRLESEIRMPLDQDAVEGRRFLLRTLNASIATFVEEQDTLRPKLVHAEGPSRKMFADNPDTDYLRASIRLDDGGRYVLRGVIPPGTLYVGICLYRKGGKVGRAVADRDLKRDTNGRFELFIGLGERGGGQWLVGEGDETAVIVRQYFGDRGKEKPIELTIERLGDLPAPAPLRASDLGDRLVRSQRMLESVFSRTLGAYKAASMAALNKFIEVPGDQLFPTPDNTYRVGWYRLGPDQLMLVRGELPRARYFGLCLYNGWMESLDYERHRIHVNHTALGPRFEVCIAHRDLGHPLWLDTAGHAAGYVLARALLLEGEMPSLECEILYEKEWEERQLKASSPGSPAARR
jgi:hypothetical protein